MSEWTNETLTDAIVEESVYEAMGAMEQHHDLLGKRLSEAASYIVMERPPGNDLIRLHEIRDELTPLIASVAACKEGCNACCHMAVSMTSIDAERIADHIGVPAAKVQTNPDNRENVSKYHSVPCPFLKKKRCTIYEVRPSACRTHFNVSKFPEVCDLVNFPNRDVPSVDLRPLWTAEGLVSLKMGAEIADIREFFPEGANPVFKM